MLVLYSSAGPACTHNAPPKAQTISSPRHPIVRTRLKLTAKFYRRNSKVETKKTAGNSSGASLLLRQIAARDGKKSQEFVILMGNSPSDRAARVDMFPRFLVVREQGD